MFNRTHKRTKEDKGNATVVLGLMLIMALMVVGALLLDVSKAYQLKSSYIDTAKKATQSAIMKQSTEGYLNPEAAGEAVRVYEKLRESVIQKDGYFSKCTNYTEDDVRLMVSFINEDGSKVFPMGEVKRSSVKSTDSAKQIADKMGALTNSKINNIKANKYTGVELSLKEGTENVIMPGALNITQADSEQVEGARCQKMGVVGKAHIFVGEEEGKYN